MRYATPLIRATLRQRYKRFLADVTLSDGQEITAHVANPGKMTGLAQEGQGVWLEHIPDPKRKLPWSWRLSEVGTGQYAGVDTGAANRVVSEALEAGAIPELATVKNWRAEVRYGENSRIDFLGETPQGQPIYLEVKSVTLSRSSGLAEFPDTKTARGAKHMAELAEVVKAGAQAYVLFLLQRNDCDRVGIAADIDPAYAKAFTAARASGVGVIAAACDLSPEGIGFAGIVPFDPSGIT